MLRSTQGHAPRWFVSILCAAVICCASFAATDQKEPATKSSAAAMAELLAKRDFPLELQARGLEYLASQGITPDRGDGWKALIDALRIFEPVMTRLDKEAEEGTPSCKVHFELVFCDCENDAEKFKDYEPTLEQARRSRELAIKAIDECWAAGLDAALEKLKRSFHGVRWKIGSQEYADYLRERGLEHTDSEGRISLALLPEIGTSRALVRMQLARMSLAVKSGDWMAAIKHAETNYAIARIIGRQGTLIDYVVGEVASRYTTSTLVKLMQAHRAPETALVELESAIGRQNASSSALMRFAFACEQLIWTECSRWLFDERGDLRMNRIEEIAGKIDHPVVRTRISLEKLDRVVQVIDEEFTKLDEYFQKVEKITPGDALPALFDYKSEMYTPGHGVAAILIPSWSNPISGSRLQQSSLAALLTLIAAERFERANGRWPRGWEELTGSFVKSPLIDPISNQQLVPRLEDDNRVFVCYSIGTDGVDNHGRSRPDDVNISQTTDSVGFDEVFFRVSRSGRSEPPPSSATQTPKP